MKIKLNTFVFFAVLFAVMSCASVCFGQEDDEAGGYVSASVSDSNVVAAARFAVKERADKQNASINLVSINNAQMQVVAGINYALCMQVNVKGKDDEEAAEQYVKVVVYRNLKNVFSLTDWAEEDCAK
jgi:Aspartic acid proteinase inhibitor